MSEQAKSPFDLLVEQIRAVVREEIAAALKTESNGQRNVADKDWLKADEAAQLYGLPKTWFEERGRTGDIARTKPGRYVLFARRDIERYLEEHKRKKGLTSLANKTT